MNDTFVGRRREGSQARSGAEGGHQRSDYREKANYLYQKVQPPPERLFSSCSTVAERKQQIAPTRGPTLHTCTLIRWLF